MADNAITSVSSTTGAALQVQQPRADRQADSARDANRAQAADAATRTRPAEPPREPERTVETRPVEQPRPVLNTEGQTTGRLINTTA